MRNQPSHRIPTSVILEESISAFALVALAIAHHPTICGAFIPYQNETAAYPEYAHFNVLVSEQEEDVQPQCPNWSNAGLVHGNARAVMNMIIAAASMVYGAVHVSAWNYFFPTHFKRLLW